MENDYKVLGLEQGASQKEIKKAYFSLVRKYSPEENPEKFREIREAYERLKDPAENQGPMFARPSEPLAEKFLDLYLEHQNAKDVQSARDVCEEAWKRFPEEIQFLYYLAVAQRRAGNSGKSVKSCEELVKREPDNKWFWREMALSYEERSYTRKAFLAYEKAYELGCRDNQFLLDFSVSCDNYEQYDRGIQVLTEIVRKDRRWKREEISDVLEAYSGLLTIYIRTGRNLGSIRVDFNHFIRQYSIYMSEHFELAAMIAAGICLEPKQDKESMQVIQEILSAVERLCTSEQEKEWFVKLRRQRQENRMMTDARLTETIRLGVQTYFLMDEEGAELKSFAVLDFKLCMIEEREEVLPQLEIIEEEYPEYYEKIHDFAEQLKDKKNLSYIKSSLLKQYTRLAKYIDGGRYFEKYPEERKKAIGTLVYQNEDDKPYVRSGKKIGRNAPCPCGSGKKYKHCCMKKENAGV